MSSLSISGARLPAAEGERQPVSFVNDAQLPAVLGPTAPDRRGPADLAALMAQPETKAVLARYGAVLFRGFAIANEDDFAAFVQLHYGDRTSNYAGGLTPRNQVREGLIYESTNLAKHLRIHQHNEMSYVPRPPRDLIFFCMQTAPVGGATPLTDCRKLMADIPEEVRQVFAKRGLRYRNHFFGRFWSPGNRIVNWFIKVHRSWRDAFEVKSRREVEERCAKLGLKLEWMWDRSVRVTRIGPAMARHPDTGEEVWFNQVNAQMVTPRIYGWPKYLGFLFIYPFKRWRPFDVSFADGGRISRLHLKPILDAMDRNTKTFQWQAGDVLWCDNFLVSHGRLPYEGPRRVLVAIGPTVDRDIGAA